VVITREAEAIAALASVGKNASICSSCGAEAVDDSRFCRRCGVPMLGEPAELQILQLTNDAHAGTRDISIGVIGFTLAVITFVLIIAIKGMGELTAAAVFTLMWALPSLILMVMGFRHLFRTFSPKQTEKVIASGSRSSSIPTELSTGGLTELPPISVTENTTNLLTPLHKIKEPVLVERKDKSVS
jgi:ribosomal protein L40E